jgi:DNA-binding MarR family transcriptional regulator
VTKFRISPGRDIELGPMARDMPFMMRTLQALMRPEGQAIRSEVDLPPGAIGVLAVIWLNPGISQNELASAVALKKSAVTKLVKDLETRGILVRERVSQDRRINSLTLSHSGQALIGRIRHLTKAWNDKLFAEVAPEDREAFFRVLETILTGYVSRAALEASLCQSSSA